MLSVLIAVLVAALVFWLALVVHLPWIVALIAAILVLVAGFSTRW